MSRNTIRVEQDGHLAHVVLNRPEVRNAMNTEMHRELHDTWRELQNDAKVRVVILSGAGEAFCAGRDVKELTTAQGKDRSTPREDPRHPDYGKLGLVPPDFDKPIVGAINGYAVGGGIGMVLGCDIRIAAETVWLGDLHASIGQFGGFGRIVGSFPDSAAAELLLAGGRLTALDCHRLGIFNRVVPSSEVMPTAEALAARILKSSPRAVRTYKRMLQLRRQDRTTATDHYLYRVMEDMQRNSEDGREGARAFTERREPQWTGE